MKEKLNLLGNKLKYWAKELWYFISSVLFLKNFAGMIGSLVILLLLTVWFLRCYTDHGDAIPVSDFVGMTYAEAMKVANKADLSLQIMDSVFIVNREPGMVLDQSPKPGLQVKEGRSIYLTITKFQPDMFPLPILAESSYDYNLYKKILKRKGITAEIKERVFDPRQAANSIVYLEYDGERIEDSDIKKGVEIPMGDTINFVITESVSRTVQIPSLICKTYDEAEFLISNSALSLGNVIEDGTVGSRADAYVWKQEPGYTPSTQINKGTSITVYLTGDLPNRCQ